MLELQIRGVRVRISLLFPAVLVVLLSWDKTGIPAWCVLASLLHELGHLTALCALGGRPARLDVGFFGMRMVIDRERPLSYAASALVSLAGPITNLLMLALLLPLTGPGPQVWVHATLAGLNLLPIEPLDGGQALQAIVAPRLGEEKAARLLTGISFVTLFLLALAGSMLWIASGYNFTLTALCAYLTLLVIVRMPGT